MRKTTTVLVALAALFAAGCATIPQDGDVVFAKVTHVFQASEFADATTNKAAFQGFFGERRLSMLEAAIRAGVTLDDVKRGRLVAAECSCGPECYTSYPLLLPGPHTTRLHDLVEIRTGTNTWQRDTRRYSYTLVTFIRRPGLPMDQWATIEGNHSHLPACFPDRWRSLGKGRGNVPPMRNEP